MIASNLRSDQHFLKAGSLIIYAGLSEVLVNGCYIVTCFRSGFQTADSLSLKLVGSG
jgi:hypothetical protein